MVEKHFTLEELHSVMLEMMVCIDKFCRERNIRYSLGGGSLLGAVRHKGFIPWDDDMDIMMPRPDYERFLKEFNGYDERYETLNCEKTTHGEFVCYFAKIHDVRTWLRENRVLPMDYKYGVFIDIFPIDGISSNSIIAKFQFVFHRRFLGELLLLKKVDWQKCSSLPRKLKKIISSLFPIKFWKWLNDTFLTFISFDESKFAGAITGIYGLKERYDSSVFKSYQSIIFEGVELRSIKQFDIYLQQHYGDYLELPPKEKRVSHCANAYWI